MADLVLWLGEQNLISFLSGLLHFPPTREETPHLATLRLHKFLEGRDRVNSQSVLVKMAAEVVVALVDYLVDCLDNNIYQNPIMCYRILVLMLYFPQLFYIKI